MSYEIDFLTADKHKHFLQIDSISLSVRSQTYPKHPKQQVYSIFAISQEKREEWSLFLPAGKATKFAALFLQSDTIILDVCGQTYLNHPK